jgi:hypothetical protein
MESEGWGCLEQPLTDERANVSEKKSLASTKKKVENERMARMNLKYHYGQSNEG